MVFMSKKREYEGSRYPPDWPSHLHNRCNKFPSCKHPNPPQACDGTYACRGEKNGNPCKGTYIVTWGNAAEVMNMHKNAMRFEERAKLNAQKQTNTSSNAKPERSGEAKSSAKSARASGKASSSAASRVTKDLPAIPVDDDDDDDVPRGTSKLERRPAQRKAQHPLDPSSSVFMGSFDRSWYKPAMPAPVARRDMPIYTPYQGSTWYCPPD